MVYTTRTVCWETSIHISLIEFYAPEETEVAENSYCYTYLGYKVFGGIKYSLLLFTSDFLAYIDNVKSISRASLVSPLAMPISMIVFGINGKAREFIESIEKMKGREVSVVDIEKMYHKKKYYILNYNDIERIRIIIEVYARKKKHKHVVDLGLYKEIGKTKDEVYKEIINTLKLSKLPVRLETP